MDVYRIGVFNTLGAPDEGVKVAARLNGKQRCPVHAFAAQGGAPAGASARRDVTQIGLLLAGAARVVADEARAQAGRLPADNGHRLFAELTLKEAAALQLSHQTRAWARCRSVPGGCAPCTTAPGAGLLHKDQRDPVAPRVERRRRRRTGRNRQ